MVKILATSLFFMFWLSGCYTNEPKIVYEPQLVKVPVPCFIELPPKPKDSGTLASAKKIAGYYKQVEMLLIDCQNVAIE